MACDQLAFAPAICDRRDVDDTAVTVDKTAGVVVVFQDAAPVVETLAAHKPDIGSAVKVGMDRGWENPGVTLDGAVLIEPTVYSFFTPFIVISSVEVCSCTAGDLFACDQWLDAADRLVAVAVDAALGEVLPYECCIWISDPGGELV